MTSPQPLSPSGDRIGNRMLVWGGCIFLAAIVLALFSWTLWFGFVNFDDDAYFYLNPQVQAGLTWKGMSWGLQTGYANNWHPLTWWSLMLDAQLFGTTARGPHLINVLLHAANAVLLLLLLKRLTGAFWPSAAAVAIFALHPLRVESVAWVSERKDVLSGFFFMLTLLFYARYAQKQSRVEGRESRERLAPSLSNRMGQDAQPQSLAFDSRPSTLDYLAALFFFVLGLMSKPMLVTVPFVMLLLDYWPLGRFKGHTKSSRAIWRPLIVEKLPFFALSLAACVTTAMAQREAIMSMVKMPLAIRFENALVSGSTYVLQMFWPANLCIFYPYQLDRPLWQVAGAGALLFIVTLLAWQTRRRIPYFAAGWFWYLVMLVPVIGLVQAGSQPHADRYTYLPHIGLCLLLVWGIRDLTASWPNRSWFLSAASMAAVGCLMLGTSRQLSSWRDSESLWSHALACTSRNFTAHDYLGAALAAKGRTDEAIAEYRKALALNPGFVDAHNDLAEALFKEGRFDEAEEHYCSALRVNPNLPEAQNHLGILLAQKGKTAEATTHFQNAVDLVPDYVEAENNLGSVLAAQGRTAEAVQHFQNVLKYSPDHAQAQYNVANLLAAAGRLDEAIDHYGRAAMLMSNSTHVHYQYGVALQRRGRFGLAIEQFEQVLALDPRHAAAQNNLAWLLATCPDPSLRDGRKALELARQPEQLSGGKSPEILDTLAAAYAESGDFQKAVETARRALSLVSTQTNSPLADALETRLKLYESNTAYHERP